MNRRGSPVGMPSFWACSGEALAISSAGIEAALNAGLRVYALRPRHGERIDQSRAFGVIERLGEVLERLGEM